MLDDIYEIFKEQDSFNSLSVITWSYLFEIIFQDITRPSLSRLFNVLDSSLKKNLISVLSTNQLEKPETKSNPVPTGFGAFFRQVDIDEYIANEPMICMKTQLKNENEVIF